MTQPPKTYVLYTEHKKEDHLAEYLNSTVQKLYPEAAARIYVPKAIRMWHYRDRDGNKKWKEVEEPLFFNYVFVESSNVEALNQILKSLRIETTYHIVGKNRIPDVNATYEEHPIVPVSDMEMEKINELLGTNGIVGKSTFIKEGSQVEFLSGPLLGREASITKLCPSKHYAVMEMEFLGEKRNISMAIEMIRDMELAAKKT